MSLGSAGTALALKSDRDEPVYMEAVEVDVDFKTGTRTLRREVVMTQGTTQIFADKVVAEFVDGDLSETTAWGEPAIFETLPDGEEQLVIATGDRLHFDNIRRIVTLEGDAAIDQKGDVVSGGLITYDLNTEVFKVRRSQAVAAGEPASGSSGEAAGAAPRIVVQPSPEPDAAASAADAGEGEDAAAASTADAADAVAEEGEPGAATADAELQTARAETATENADEASVSSEAAVEASPPMEEPVAETSVSAAPQPAALAGSPGDGAGEEDAAPAEVFAVAEEAGAKAPAEAMPSPAGAMAEAASSDEGPAPEAASVSAAAAPSQRASPDSPEDAPPDDGAERDAVAAAPVEPFAAAEAESVKAPGALAAESEKSSAPEPIDVDTAPESEPEQRLAVVASESGPTTSPPVGVFGVAPPAVADEPAAPAQAEKPAAGDRRPPPRPAITESPPEWALEAAPAETAAGVYGYGRPRGVEPDSQTARLGTLSFTPEGAAPAETRAPSAAMGVVDAAPPGVPDASPMTAGPRDGPATAPRPAAADSGVDGSPPTPTALTGVSEEAGVASRLATVAAAEPSSEVVVPGEETLRPAPPAEAPSAVIQEPDGTAPPAGEGEAIVGESTVSPAMPPAEERTPAESPGVALDRIAPPPSPSAADATAFAAGPAATAVSADTSTARPPTEGTMPAAAAKPPSREDAGEGASAPPAGSLGGTEAPGAEPAGEAPEGPMMPLPRRIDAADAPSSVVSSRAATADPLALSPERPTSGDAATGADRIALSQQADAATRGDRGEGKAAGEATSQGSEPGGPSAREPLQLARVEPAKGAAAGESTLTGAPAGATAPVERQVAVAGDAKERPAPAVESLGGDEPAETGSADLEKPAADPAATEALAAAETAASAAPGPEATPVEAPADQAAPEAVAAPASVEPPGLAEPIAPAADPGEQTGAAEPLAAAPGAQAGLAFEATSSAADEAVPAPSAGGEGARADDVTPAPDASAVVAATTVPEETVVLATAAAGESIDAPVEEVDRQAGARDTAARDRPAPPESVPADAPGKGGDATAGELAAVETPAAEPASAETPVDEPVAAAGIVPATAQPPGGSRIPEALQVIRLLYETYYRLGDADRILNLFATGAVENDVRGKAGIRDGYERVFARTQSRDALIEILEAVPSGDGGLSARGTLAVTHEQRNGRQIEDSGPVEFALVEEGGRLRIERMVSPVAPSGTAEPKAVAAAKESVPRAGRTRPANETAATDERREAVAAFVVFYETYYELGDAKRLAELFAADAVDNASRGKAAIRDAYARLFADTTSRRALIEVLETRRTEDGRVAARGTLSVTRTHTDGSRVENTGAFELSLQDKGGVLRIARLTY